MCIGGGKGSEEKEKRREVIVGLMEIKTRQEV